jgi:NAD(P)-dependent dehydrogenase (short-subunit alcohol dehydrogenase family)
VITSIFLDSLYFFFTWLGIETQFATNHIAHHYLTMLLLPVLEKSTPSRIVTVSSLAHALTFSKLNLDSISDPKAYDRGTQYSKSKVT